MGSDDDICRILQLSDCTMMYILSCLDATSLFNLSRTCSYFKNIVKEPKLWRYIDARGEPNTTKKIKYVSERVHDKTSHLFLRAESKYRGNLSQDNLVSWFSLENLVILALENQRFNGKSLFLSDFPKTLEELSLKKTFIKNGKAFFQGSFHRMSNLRVLILDECNWIDSHFLMSVSKYENLEILSMVNCQRLHFNITPYLSVVKNSFKKLKVLDSRFNTISNEIIKNLGSHQALLAIYCQSMRSYQFDRSKPLFQDGYQHLTNESKQILLESIIKNDTLEQYLRAVGENLQELPKSILYKDPYSKCTCGYKDRQEQEQTPLNKENQVDAPAMVTDDFINFQHPQKLFCQKHLGKMALVRCDLRPKTEEVPASTNSSDSESDENCCMFGRECRTEVIVVNVRERDERGNIPHAELFNFSDFPSLVLGSNITRREEQNSTKEREPQPSTSKSEEETATTSAKRKLDGGEFPNNHAKKAKHHDAVDNIADIITSKEYADKILNDPSSDSDSDSKSTEPQPSTSKSAEKMPSTSSKRKFEESHPGNSGHSVKKTKRRCSTNNASDLSKPSTSKENSEIPNDAISDTDSESEEGPNNVNKSRQNPNQNRSLSPLHYFRMHNLLPRCAIRVDIFDENITLRVANNEFYVGEMPEKKLQLRRLSLRGYRNISDIALNLIKNLNLNLLDLTYTSVTKQAIEKFLVFNPSCRVVHKDFCICKPNIPC